MLDFPYNFIVFNSFIDIFLLNFVILSISYYVYYIFFRKQVVKLIILDLKIFVILLAVNYMNYKGVYLYFSEDRYGSGKIWWFWYFILIYFSIEILFYLFFSKKIGITFKDIENDIDKNLVPVSIERQEKKIRELISSLNFLKNELNNVRESDIDESTKKSNIEYLNKEIERKKKDIKNEDGILNKMKNSKDDYYYD